MKDNESETGTLIRAVIIGKILEESVKRFAFNDALTIPKRRDQPPLRRKSTCTTNKKGDLKRDRLVCLTRCQIRSRVRRVFLCRFGLHAGPSARRVS